MTKDKMLVGSQSVNVMRKGLLEGNGNRVDQLEDHTGIRLEMW